jgi:hypothetical protein
MLIAVRSKGMTGESLWNEWQDILENEFEGRMEAISTKAYHSSAGKSITVLFLLIKGFEVQTSDILSEAIGIITDRGRKDTSHNESSSIDAEQIDTVAMMGHRIGMVENIADLKKYLSDIHQQLKPDGQVLLTAFSIQEIKKPRRLSTQKQNVQFEGYPKLSNMQFQYGNLIGPFFSFVNFNAESLKKQAAMTGWQLLPIYHGDDRNYSALLTVSELV